MRQVNAEEAVNLKPRLQNGSLYPKHLGRFAFFQTAHVAGLTGALVQAVGCGKVAAAVAIVASLVS